MPAAEVASARIGVRLDRIGGLLDFVARCIQAQPDMRIVQGASPPDVIVTSLVTDQVDPANREAFFASTGVPLLAISADRQRMSVHEYWEVRVQVYDRSELADVGLEELI